MVINHLEKLLVTNDAATILRELEVSLDDVNLCSQETQDASQNLSRCRFDSPIIQPVFYDLEILSWLEKVCFL